MHGVYCVSIDDPGWRFLSFVLHKSGVGLSVFKWQALGEMEHSSRTWGLMLASLRDSCVTINASLYVTCWFADQLF